MSTYIRIKFLFYDSGFNDFLAGLRVRYNDTATYISAYENLDISGNILSNISWNIGDNPAFNLINLILKK